MAKKTEVESRIAVVPIPGWKPDTYTNEKLLEHGPRSASGSSLVSQVVAAAYQTVSAEFALYSCQTTFVRPVNPKEKVTYNVERIADGRTYATRLVRVIQGVDNTCVLVSTILFQNTNIPPRNALKYSTPMPDPGTRPEDIPAERTTELIELRVDGAKPILYRGAEHEPFEWRYIYANPVDDPSQVVTWGFFRSPPLSSDSRSTHLTALAYASDEFLMGPVMYGNLEKVGGRTLKNVTQVASLTHNLSFHDANAKVDDWIFFQRTSSWAADGRVLAHQQLWNWKTGQLIMSGTQEASMRLKDSKDATKL